MLPNEKKSFTSRLLQRLRPATNPRRAPAIHAGSSPESYYPESPATMYPVAFIPPEPRMSNFPLVMITPSPSSSSLESVSPPSSPLIVQPSPPTPPQVMVEPVYPGSYSPSPVIAPRSPKSPSRDRESRAPQVMAYPSYPGSYPPPPMIVSPPVQPSPKSPSRHRAPQVVVYPQYPRSYSPPPAQAPPPPQSSLRDRESRAPQLMVYPGSYSSPPITVIGPPPVQAVPSSKYPSRDEKSRASQFVVHPPYPGSYSPSQVSDPGPPLVQILPSPKSPPRDRKSRAPSKSIQLDLAGGRSSPLEPTRQAPVPKKEHTSSSTVRLRTRPSDPAKTQPPRGHPASSTVIAGPLPGNHPARTPMNERSMIATSRTANRPMAESKQLGSSRSPRTEGSKTVERRSGSHKHDKDASMEPPSDKRSSRSALKTRKREGPSAEYLAMELSDNPLGLTDMIPTESHHTKEDDLISAATRTPRGAGTLSLEQAEPAKWNLTPHRVRGKNYQVPSNDKHKRSRNGFSRSLHGHSSLNDSLISAVDITDASLRQLPVRDAEITSNYTTSILSSDLSEIMRLGEDPASDLFTPLRLMSPESVNFATMFQLRSTHEGSHPLKPSNMRRSIRKGFWNRRGDHLTEDGFIVYAPHDQVYPHDLQDYPSESEGYHDEYNNFMSYAVREEHPDSLPRRGNAPVHPYLSFVEYI